MILQKIFFIELATIIGKDPFKITLKSNNQIIKDPVMILPIWIDERYQTVYYQTGTEVLVLVLFNQFFVLGATTPQNNKRSTEKKTIHEHVELEEKYDKIVTTATNSINITTKNYTIENDNHITTTKTYELKADMIKIESTANVDIKAGAVMNLQSPVINLNTPTVNILGATTIAGTCLAGGFGGTPAAGGVMKSADGSSPISMDKLKVDGKEIREHTHNVPGCLGGITSGNN